MRLGEFACPCTFPKFAPSPAKDGGVEKRGVFVKFKKVQEPLVIVAAGCFGVLMARFSHP